MDFFRISTKEVKGEAPALYPDFVVGRSKDLMVRGRAFYAIWDEKEGLWSTDEYAVQRLVDEKLREYAESLGMKTGEKYNVKYLQSFSNGGWAQFRKYVNHVSDNSHDLDSNLTFANTDVKKTDYVSRRLPYSLCPGDYSAWDELIGTLYSVEERAKIEWTIGAVVSGDSKRIQKFAVLYGPAGTGKSTVLNIVTRLFEGYTTTFDAKALGGNQNAFSTEVFKNNPLVAIQHDGDLSKIEDNTKLNSLISHEMMTMNEKYKPSYTSQINAFLYMGTNQPVKISDSKSGLLRRLIDIHPTGVIIPAKRYSTLLQQIEFELGAIAQHCLDVYREMGKNYYSAYRPLTMMFQTDIFFNFVESVYDVFKDQDSTTLKQAYLLYKEFCSNSGIDRVQPMYKVREELKDYFDIYKDRTSIDGSTVRDYYSGFNANKYKVQVRNETTFSLVMEETESILDDILKDQPAQGSKLDDFDREIPKGSWAKCATVLSDIDTSTVHFVKVPENHIVIDFDLKDEDGNKSLERNLEAASAWPPTYGELSKGGGGVHLHYLYEGDPSGLSPVYSDGIEVKTLLGDASLRRRLSRCNNIPIAVLNGGLPLKEKKVNQGSTMKSERGLRDLIARTMQKEFHAGTKPATEFIVKIMQEAYDSGMPYDVTDLRAMIIGFANNSSNQALYCLSLIPKMKFKSDETAEGKWDAGLDDGPEEPIVAETPQGLFFFDVEVFPNLFVLCGKFEGETDVVKMINPSPQDIEKLLKFKLVGFYNRRYDNHMLYARYMGYDNETLFKLSQDIIVNKKKDAFFGEAYNLSYADIWDFSSLKQSLKLFEIQLGLPHKEINIPWDQPVPDNLIETVVDYCVNDVMATEATFNARKQDFVARQILADLSGLAVNETTQRHTARIIFGIDRYPQQDFKYTDLSKEFEGYTFDPTRTPKSLYRDEDPSEGGYVYSEPGMYFDVPVLDAASMHPTSIVQLNLFGPYTPNFAALLEARLAIKGGDYETARTLLNGKLAPHLNDPADASALSYALKIVINIVYGLTSATFDNPFRDRRNIDNIVAKRGALFMIDLKLACQDKGLRVAHIKTDSIKVPGATQEDVDEIVALGEKYGYTMEHEITYDRMCLVNDAVYIARANGKWHATGAQFAHPYVFKTLFSKEDITFDDLCETRQVTKGAMYLNYNLDVPKPEIDSMAFVGRTGRFVPVKEGCGGAMLYRVADDKLYAVTGTKGRLWLEADAALALGDKIEIDMDYFQDLANEAVKTIEKFGSFKEFTS